MSVEVYAVNGNRIALADRPPGVTLAEALGLNIPANAPGGARVLAPSSTASRQRRPGFDAWVTSEEYEGFSDPDGWRRTP